MYNVVAYQVAGTINLKESKKQLPWQLLFQDSDELYYQVSEHAFMYLFQYGMVSFFNLTTVQINTLLEQINPFCNDYFSENFSENVDVIIEPNKLNVQFNLIVLPALDQEMIRLVMMNASQSVALDRYSEITENLIIETNQHTLFLEKHGRINISEIN
ncbi:RMD1 family protein [Lacinutrix neustonica]|uniref:RMD1 family protein n=1 Tax=Lacinutrix neustonica TaxID=2980107 RepID=A0A9E8SG61_9FLAO|nr:RMD1 family protein [Lacinutrix neustonica]WAC01400.1 RMD1 family protein [Lacinutrix neustonica]